MLALLALALLLAPAWAQNASSIAPTCSISSADGSCPEGWGYQVRNKQCAICPGGFKGPGCKLCQTSAACRDRLGTLTSECASGVAYSSQSRLKEYSCGLVNPDLATLLGTPKLAFSCDTQGSNMQLAGARRSRPSRRRLPPAAVLRALALLRAGSRPAPAASAPAPDPALPAAARPQTALATPAPPSPPPSPPPPPAALAARCWGARPSARSTCAWAPCPPARSSSAGGRTGGARLRESFGSGRQRAARARGRPPRAAPPRAPRRAAGPALHHLPPPAAPQGLRLQVRGGQRRRALRARRLLLPHRLQR